MSGVIEISAEAERPETEARAGFPRRTRHEEKPLAGQLAAHQFPAREHTDEAGEETLDGILEGDSQQRRDEEEDRERERRIYRGRTVAMLRRYMRYSIETGRMPSLLGTEFFRAKMTAYTVVTFEDRVIFVRDMEKCLDRLDEFSRQLIARHILQEHDRWGTAKLLHCNEKKIRRCTPLVLDLISQILLDVGLMKRLEPIQKNCCQEGGNGPFDVSDCADDE